MNIKCPECGSTKAQKLRKMWKKIDGKLVEGMQYRCQECKRYFVIY